MAQDTETGPGGAATPRPGGAPAPERPLVIRTRPVSRERNRILGVALASFAVLVFVAIVSLTVMVHYAETHPAIAHL